jgi:hypothetical protein
MLWLNFKFSSINCLLERLYRNMELWDKDIRLNTRGSVADNTCKITIPTPFGGIASYCPSFASLQLSMDVSTRATVSTADPDVFPGLE